MAVPILPVNTRVRLNTRLTASHAAKESNTSDGVESGAKDRARRSKPLAQCNSSTGMRALAKKCRTANSGAVSKTATHWPDSRSIAECIAPRITVSSISATAMPELKPTRSSLRTECVPAPMRQCIAKSSAAPAAAVAMPEINATVTNRRQGRP
jgi:hypothetical protein